MFYSNRRAYRQDQRFFPWLPFLGGVLIGGLTYPLITQNKNPQYMPYNQVPPSNNNYYNNPYPQQNPYYYQPYNNYYPYGYGYSPR